MGCHRLIYAALGVGGRRFKCCYLDNKLESLFYRGFFVLNFNYQLILRGYLMIILFTLWFVLQWQFPAWLWVFAGFFYVISLRPKKKIKKQVSFDTKVLPLYLALAIIFGKDILGNPILPEATSVWVIIGILIGSVFIRLIVASPVIKKQISKSKNNDNNSNVTIHGSGFTINDDDELKLYIKIKNKKKNKSSNFKISLENGFIKEVFIKNIIIKGMKNAWKDPVFHDGYGKPLFDIHQIYDKAKKNPIRGDILTIDNEKVNIVISIN